MIYENGFDFVLIAIIAIVLFLIMVLLMVTICRRVYNARKYIRLDKQREEFRKKLIGIFESGSIPDGIEELVARPKSLKWISMENVLMDLIEEEKFERKAKELFHRCGYITFYQKKMQSRNVITKASAIDKLGKMRSDASLGKMVPLLGDEDPEIVGVVVRSLSRIGSTRGLRGILEVAPGLLSGARITRKTLETSLIHFGPRSVPTLIEYGERYADPAARASLLEVLSNMPGRESLPFALANIDHPDPEVRSKALKVVGAVGTALPESDKEKVLSRLEDPVWFVRLQAAKALGNLKYEKAEVALGERLLDPTWQVRNAAATALAKGSGKAIDIFLHTLYSRDRYARESVCEEIEKTGFVAKLIQNLDARDRQSFMKSREILKIMQSLNYITPLTEYEKTGPNERIRREIELILGMEPAA